MSDIFNSKEGYNLASDLYDSWIWQSIWSKIDGNLIKKWIVNSKKCHFLDLGIGTGNFIDIIYPSVKSFTGVDSSELMLQKAKNKHCDKNITLINEDVLNFSINKKFSKVLSTRVLGHINPKLINKFFQNISVLSEENASLLITDLHPEYSFDFSHVYHQDKKNGIKIQNYSHNLNKIIKALENNSFKVKSIKEFSKKDLLNINIELKNSSKNLNHLKNDHKVYLAIEAIKV